MSHERDIGADGQGSPRGGSNGFVNRRSTVQSRPPAHSSDNTETLEEWRPIPGLEGWYEASSLGRIRRSAIASVSGIPAVMVGFDNNRTGYRGITLRFAGRCHTRNIHRLVAETFLGPCPPGYQVNHIDGVKNNNRASNLEYVTPEENIAHSIRMGLRPKHRKSRAVVA